MSKKAKEPEKESGERWLLTYSDLITLLLAFFIILYAKAVEAAGEDSKEIQALYAGLVSGFSSGQNVFEFSGTSIIDGYSGSETMSVEDIESRTLDAVKEAVSEIAEDYGFSDSVEVTVDDEGIHIRIKDAVLFNSGSYLINDNAVPIMQKIGDVLKKLPTNYIQVEGHTDNVPINNGVIASNWELGSLRAVNIAKMLIHDCALTPKFVSALSYGEFRPIATNDTEEGRAKNRRVEITILRNYPINKE